MSFVPASSIAPATVTVAGTVAVSNFPASQAVTGPLTDAQLRASAVPVSGSVSVANFPATQPVSGTVAVSAVSGTVTTDGSGHTQPVSGSVAVSNLPATQPVSGTVAVSAVAGTVLTDGSAHTQPVSGTVTANQGTAGAAWPISAATLPLPAGAATAAAQTDGTQRVGGTVTTDGSGHTQPVSGTVAVSGVSGTVTVDGSAVTQPISAASLPLPAGAATEATLVEVKRAANDTALTAILERDKIPA